MIDPNHDIVPTLRMFDGVMTGQAADEIEMLRKRITDADTVLRQQRSLYFKLYPANTCLAIGFNAILGALGTNDL